MTEYQWDHIDVLNVHTGHRDWWIVPRGVHPPYPYHVIARKEWANITRQHLPAYFEPNTKPA